MVHSLMLKVLFPIGHFLPELRRTGYAGLWFDVSGRLRLRQLSPSREILVYSDGYSLKTFAAIDRVAAKLTLLDEGWYFL